MYELTVDNVTYENLVCSIKRQAELRASDVSGFLMDGSYHNDVLGTYMQYTVTVAVPVGAENEYADLYEVLTDPVASHTFILPYNQDSISVVGRVGIISDSYYREVNDVALWRRISFTVTANTPRKVPS